ncbi:unnamed protein product [Linum tenue]|uniref:Cytochrome P450 n=1 Tax=Linum tenue TaxID=586396 RepID=A0AAV0JY47_9ROSI|nr:unnamed protein product [Linum tenue]
MRELLSNSRLDASYMLRKQEVGKALADVYWKKRGEALDFGKLVFMTISNTILSMLWGSTIHGKEGEKFFSRVRELSSDFVALQGAANVSDYIPGLARQIEIYHREIKAFTMLSMYLSKSVADHSHRMLDAIIGGTDTTSTTIEWTMAELMQHPDAMQKVIKELDEVVGRSYAVEEFHLPKLCYLDVAIKETIRLHPTVPILVPRSARGDSDLGGYTFPKGATVFINAYAIQRDPYLWDSPLEFRPERFLG